MLKILQNTTAQLLIIIFLTALAYSNIFPNQLVLDDKPFILEWQSIKSFDHIVELLKGDVPSIHQGIYRPIRSLLYLIYYQIFSINLMGYHLQSIIVHLLSTILVFLIIKKIIREKWAAFGAGLLFGLHPIHTESITYIAASMEMTGVVFFLASFYFYLRGSGSCRSRAPQFTHCANKRGAPLWGSPARATPHFYYILSIILAVLAFFTYEMTLTLPALIILYDLCFHPGGSKIKNLWFKGRVYLPYLAGVAAFFFVRLVILKISVDRGDYLGYSFYHTMLTMPRMIAKYIGLLIAPVNLSYIHEVAPGFESFMTRYSNIQSILSQSIFDLDVLLSLGLILALIVIGVKIRKISPPISFGIGWFFISLIPVSYILPQGIAIAEKYLYIPSVGFVLILAVLLNKLARFKKQLAWGLLIGLMAGFGYLTYQRNRDWKDPIVFWSKILEQHPGSSLANYTLGVLFSEKGDLDRASSYYLKAIELEPRFVEARFNLGNIYSKKGKSDLASEQYRQILMIDPSFIKDLKNLPAEDQSEWAGYEGDGLAFDYPKSWKITATKDGVKVRGGQDFVIEIRVGERKIDLSVDQYLAKQSSSYGSLISQGLAQVPNVDLAYVKIWQDGGTGKMEFFLFKADRVVKILVYPSDSPLIKQFDEIVKSLKIK